jgi:predicted rRNA methylase YqxC with S4 and FtsJ domains
MILKRKLILWYYKNREPYKTRRALRDFHRAISFYINLANTEISIRQIAASKLPEKTKFILCVDSIIKFSKYLKPTGKLKNDINNIAAQMETLKPSYRPKYEKGGVVTGKQMGIMDIENNMESFKQVFEKLKKDTPQ